MDLLIKNGTIITASDTLKADILISDGKITGIGNGFTAIGKEIDASGKYIIPGGIDPHVHLHLETPAGTSSDDFYSGTRAALFGGTTTVIDFVTPKKGESLMAALEKRIKQSENSIADHSFHVSPIEWHENIPDEMLECRNAGISSFKVYLAYRNTIGLDFDELYNVMIIAAQINGVVVVHCEMNDEIEELRNGYFESGFTTPEYHAKSRPAIYEAMAVKKAIELAEKAGCTLYIVHVSSVLSLIKIREARQKKQAVIAETCPQYLLLDDSKYHGNFTQTAPYVMSPPLRNEEDNHALWNAIKDGAISTIGTDHCPFMMEQKESGKYDFRKIPNGAGGIEHRLELLYTYAVLMNKISLNKWVEICSTAPAMIFGLYPAKGEIAPDSDADIVIWDPKTERQISPLNHNQNCDHNIYEGLIVKGQAETVIRNGIIIIENRKMIENPPKGRFLKR
jgi:dihydropyrimidinase